MTDKELYRLCKKYGRKALLWRRRFVGLLPEVSKRRLWEKKGFGSIFEFAAKLAGLSQEQVRLALNLERRFSGLPVLKGLLVEGEVSLNKLARVVSIATVENEGELAEKVTQLGRKALETLVRDEGIFQKQNGLCKPLFEAKSLHVQTLNFKLSGVVIERLNELHAQGKNVNELLVGLLKERKEKIKEKKERLSKEAKRTDSRYMMVETRELLEDEYGEKCSIKTCLKKAEEIHHAQRFSLAHTHDPKYLAPLCREHHQIAHAVDGKVVAYRTSG